VADGLILETTFLIDMEREVSIGHTGPALQFLEGHGASPLYVTFTVAGEMAVGIRAGISISESKRAADRCQRPLDCGDGDCV
jgi:hypothetical protein